MEYKNETDAELGAELVKLRKQIAKLGENNSKPQKTEKNLNRKWDKVAYPGRICS